MWWMDCSNQWSDTCILNSRRVVSVEPFWHKRRTLNFEEHTCSWKTVTGASCGRAPQSDMCHVVFDRAARVRVRGGGGANKSFHTTHVLTTVLCSIQNQQKKKTHLYPLLRSLQWNKAASGGVKRFQADRGVNFKAVNKLGLCGHQRKKQATLRILFEQLQLKNQQILKTNWILLLCKSRQKEPHAEFEPKTQAPIILARMKVTAGIIMDSRWCINPANFVDEYVL